MGVNYYNHQETVAKNLIAIMRKKGYSRQTISKLTDIPRSAIDSLLLRGGENINESVYNSYIIQINQTFGFAEDYFLKETPKPNYSPPAPPTKTERSARTQELLNGLDIILDIYSMYKK
ncbi:hypothetical protein D3P08_00140 [Paenibacillus nanensis]|uniref:XRE family transcriptional regulator n=1 Tax=Paenibacillus nanensis TaxID=393251 RepID=A0A3A1VRB2_9BACL|nr:hypothetical protein [Paenibacillus nanensis]RIX60040.1 hypothetical protein D3P08_00140 [Paenibacillus nanensis]